MDDGARPGRGLICTVGGIKGGTGKSTTCLSLATVAAARGYEVLMVDADDQMTLKNWSGLRDNNEVDPAISCVQVQGRTLGKELERQAGKYDLVIVDCGGYDSTELRSSLLVADVFYCPASASQFEMWSIGQVLAVLREINGLREQLGMPQIEAKLFASRASYHPAHDERSKMAEDIEQARAASSEPLPVTVLQASMKDRSVHKHAAALGRSATEVDTRSDSARSARDEVLALFDEVLGDRFPVRRARA
jgi:chromosome partitioning protein